ncbi:hypothetical protein PpBr36_04271 [Pyricularia pennisetigena]|uniref:hypothetical protein n=1 Tax=Pyricularia pennisetigena TaxID=1578925 RepID=UPI0011516FBC|nr:hypothetical protein PpBr36_04271 [Pyricularia pennisetigena]TLS27310.1 hypothetical protein PpBr36_04271 [Pyricularia pennisetigena]
MSQESSYNTRRAHIHAAYLLPYLRPDHAVLDVGSGSGSITRDLATICKDGHAIGVDISAAMVSFAQETHVRAPDGPPNLSFQVADAQDLAAFPDGSFDVVHAHTCCTHVPDPVRALREFRRVLRPGGLVALREPLDIVRDVRWTPDVPGLELHAVYAAALLSARGGHPRAGTMLEAWAREAGFERIACGVGEERSAEALQVVGRGIGVDDALAKGILTEEELARLRAAYEVWAGTEGRDKVARCAEVLCFKD